jgi:hypothetical protein
VPFEFESDLFRGKALIRFRGLKASGDSASDEMYFGKRKRLNQVLIQGCFKRQVRVSDLQVGCDYEQPLKMKPPPFVNRMLQSFLRRVAPDVSMDLLGDTPYVLAGFGGSVQAMRADEPGKEPDIVSSIEIEEHNEAFGGELFRGGVNSKKRKEIFRNLKKAAGFSFDPEKVYTFEMYDDVFDYKSYEFDMKLSKYDLMKVCAEPFQIMARSKVDEKPLFFFRVWHERLVV